MRDLVITENITLDGVIDATEGWFAPAGDDDVDESDLVETIRAHREAADAFLVGRVTFEEMRSFWPKQTDDETGITDYLNRVAKYVVSDTIGDPDWANTTVLGGDLVEDITALKAADGEDIVTTGSIELVHDLIKHGLVDEYRLFVYPVVIGHGRRLFDGSSEVPKLRLVEAQSFRNGVALLRYRTD